MSEHVLLEKDSSILLIEERRRKDIVIGAPHHTLGGVKKMPCPEHTDGDENTGFIARKIAESLNIPSVIACNYRIDPNKNLRTDYALQIAQWAPKYLIEIHGHGAKGGKKPDNNTIEISSGKLERNKLSILFAETLTKKFTEHQELRTYRFIGDFENIHFKASSTATIIDDRWTAFHIELPPSIRLANDNNLTSFTDDFVKGLSETISEICK